MTNMLGRHVSNLIEKINLLYNYYCYIEWSLQTKFVKVISLVRLMPTKHFHYQICYQVWDDLEIQANTELAWKK